MKLGQFRFAIQVFKQKQGILFFRVLDSSFYTVDTGLLAAFLTTGEMITPMNHDPFRSEFHRKIDVISQEGIGSFPEVWRNFRNVHSG